MVCPLCFDEFRLRTQAGEICFVCCFGWDLEYCRILAFEIFYAQSQKLLIGNSNHFFDMAVD